MRLTSYENTYTKVQVFTLELRPEDWVRARFDDQDRMLLNECSGKDATISDQLLALEMIARRVEEADRQALEI